MGCSFSKPSAEPAQEAAAKDHWKSPHDTYRPPSGPAGSRKDIYRPDSGRDKFDFDDEPVGRVGAARPPHPPNNVFARGTGSSLSGDSYASLMGSLAKPVGPPVNRQAHIAQTVPQSLQNLPSDGRRVMEQGHMPNHFARAYSNPMQHHQPASVMKHAHSMGAPIVAPASASVPVIDLVLMPEVSTPQLRQLVASAIERDKSERNSSKARFRLDAVERALQSKTAVATQRDAVSQALRGAGNNSVELCGTQYFLMKQVPVMRGTNSVSCAVTAPNGNSAMVKWFGDGELLDRELALLDGSTAIAKVVPEVYDSAPLAPEAGPGSSSPGEPLESGFVISGRGMSLGRMLDKKSYADTSFPMEMFSRLVSLLKILHANKQVHGNLTPRHVIVVMDFDAVPNFFLTDLSCARTVGRSTYAPWGCFNVRYAAPEVVEAALSTRRPAAPAQPCCDVWSFGMVLYEVMAGKSYWPFGWGEEQIVEALLGRTKLPHEADPDHLRACRQYKSKVNQMLVRAPLKRASMMDLQREAARQIEATLTTAPPQNANLESAYRAILQQHVSSLKDLVHQSAAGVVDQVDAVGAAVDENRNEMRAIHEGLAGQQVSVTLQLWRPVEGAPSARRLCPVKIGDVAPGATGSAARREKDGGPIANTEPVFQLVQGELYYVTLLVQNRDLDAPVELPFRDVDQIRLLPRGSNQALRVQPKILEHTGQAWWGEGLWAPSEAQVDLFQDTTLTSNNNPGECKVYIYLDVPGMENLMRLSRRLLFNMHPPGTKLTIQKYYSAVVDFIQNPQTAKKEMIKTGIKLVAGVKN